MPDELNKRMDEALKAYARRRRSQAGAPVELHPATRKLLQGEASRVFPPRTFHQAPERSAPVPFLWPRLALVASIFVALTVAVLVFGPAGRKPAAPTQLAQQVEEQVVLPATGRSLDPVGPGTAVYAPAAEPARPLVATEQSVTDEITTYRARGTDPQGRSKATPPASDVPALAVAPVAAPPGPGETGGQKKRAEVRLREEPVKAESLVAQTDLAQFGAPVAGAANQYAYFYSEQDISRVAPSLSPSTVRLNGSSKDKAASPAAAQPVLLSFQLAQTGDRIEIVDADGSIYKGQVQGDDMRGARARDREMRPAELKDRALEKESRRVKAVPEQQPGSPEEQKVQTLTFRVSGTNRTLQQLVVFDGQLSPSPLDSAALTNALATLIRAQAQAAPTPGQPQTALPPQTAPAVPAPPRGPEVRSAPSRAAPAGATAPGQAIGAQQAVQATRVQGRARVGSTNEVQVNAIRLR
jgi:hypothetical protein